MKAADAVVIGAGVNGAATAYNLVKWGMKKVILVEKYLLASGGTGRSAAELVRQHYSNEELVRMVKRSVQRTACLIMSCLKHPARSATPPAVRRAISSPCAAVGWETP